MWGKNTAKTCALLRTLWKRLIQNFDTELPCSPRLFKPLREVGWWKSSHRQVYNGSPEAAHGQIQRKGFLGAYLGGRKEQPQPASGAWVCSAATPTINSCQPLVPPDPAVPCPAKPRQSSLTPQMDLGSSLPAFPIWDGPGWRISEGHLQGSQKDN